MNRAGPCSAWARVVHERVCVAVERTRGRQKPCRGGLIRAAGRWRTARRQCRPLRGAARSQSPSAWRLPRNARRRLMLRPRASTALLAIRADRLLEGARGFALPVATATELSPAHRVSPADVAAREGLVAVSPADLGAGSAGLIPTTVRALIQPAPPRRARSRARAAAPARSR